MVAVVFEVPLSACAADVSISYALSMSPVIPASRAEVPGTKVSTLSAVSGLFMATTAWPLPWVSKPIR